jgi:hypothetical protein
LNIIEVGAILGQNISPLFSGLTEIGTEIEMKVTQTLLFPNLY